MVSVFEIVAKFPPKYLAAILSGQAICGIFAALVQIFSLGIGASSQISGLVYFLIGLLFVFLTLGLFVGSLYKSRYFQHHLSKQSEDQIPKVTKSEIFEVLNNIKYYLIAMLFVTGSTAMVYPGLAALTVSMQKGNGNKWNGK